jgi:hypothetical protein
MIPSFKMDETQQIIIKETQGFLNKVLAYITEDETVMYRQDLINVLTETQKALNAEKVDLDRLDEMIFGIFRIVTDNDCLEKSSTGQDLLVLIEKLRQVFTVLE